MSGCPRLVSWAVDITECGQAGDVPFPASLLPTYHWSAMNAIIRSLKDSRLKWWKSKHSHSIRSSSILLDHFKKVCSTKLHKIRSIYKSHQL
jgi:hypothetical protein